MAYQDKKTGLLRSFGYAFSGIYRTIKSERNIKIQLAVAFLVIVAAIVFQVTLIEWVILIGCIFAVLSLELLNSAVEYVVDLVTTDFHPLAKNAKDVAAGSVLLFSIGSCIIGAIIFLPKIINYLTL